jgi:hypothetical protein
MSAIFISYRREDSEGHAGRLFQDLSDRFGSDSVFMDVADIEPGRDFRKVIDEQVAECGVLLAVIGKNWLDAADASGARRIDNPADFVRLETASALKRDIPVVPVLVHGAQMPRTEQLPADLKELSFRNAAELTHVRWASDVQLLIEALERLGIPQRSGSGNAGPARSSLPPVNLVDSAQAPQIPRLPTRVDSPASSPAPARSGSRVSMPLVAGVAAAAVLLLAAVIWLAQGSSESPEEIAAESSPPVAVAAPSGDTGATPAERPQRPGAANRVDTSAGTTDAIENTTGVARRQPQRDAGSRQTTRPMATEDSSTDTPARDARRRTQHAFGLDGQRVREADVAPVGGGDVLGSYRQTGPQTWVEYSATGQAAFTFRETGRDEWSVLLWDDQRNVGLQLDLDTRQVRYRAGPNAPYRLLYAIVDAH